MIYEGRGINIGFKELCKSLHDQNKQGERGSPYLKPLEALKSINGPLRLMENEAVEIQRCIQVLNLSEKFISVMIFIK